MNAKQLQDPVDDFRFVAANLLQVGHTFLGAGETPGAIENRFFVDRFVGHVRVSQSCRDGAPPISAQSARGSPNGLQK
jgi:hypothetical protein